MEQRTEEQSRGGVELKDCQHYEDAAHPRVYFVSEMTRIYRMIAERQEYLQAIGQSYRSDINRLIKRTTRCRWANKTPTYMQDFQ